MHGSINIPALVNQLMNLSTDENSEDSVFCIWLARDQILMIKIEVHKKHFFWIVLLLNNAQRLGQTLLILIMNQWTNNAKFH